MAIRTPAVAGSFYPDNAAELRDYCRSRLPADSARRPCRAVVLPHAGYIYSGDTACLTLSRAELTDSLLLIGPDHFAAGRDFSIYPDGIWRTPLGETAVDSGLAAALVKRVPQITPDPPAHKREHSLEVLLPLLQTCRPAARIAPLIVSTLDLDTARAAAEGIAEVLVSRPEKAAIVISNDMSHYEPDAITRAKDRYALEAIENLDAEALAHAVQKYRITMCGFVPVYMLLIMAGKIGIQKARLVDYRTSGDATGDRGRVVGYAGFIFE